MGVFETYSKRLKRQNGELPDIFQYDDVPRTVRVQIIHILDDALGDSTQYVTNRDAERSYREITSIIRREKGVFDLSQLTKTTRVNSSYYELSNFIVECDTEDLLDAVDIVFNYCYRIISRISYRGRHDNKRIIESAIMELNIRFKEAGVGYQFVDGQIIRVDSELVHQEAVKPALRLLNTNEYAGAHQEFISAYDHYKAGKNKEALNDCLKAFESTMKSICDKREWTYAPGDTAKKLIAICFEKGLIPSFWQNQFNHLQGLLESSIPTGRNKTSGHGQGAIPQSVPDEIAAYMLHMTASTLVFLTTAEQKLP